MKVRLSVPEATIISDRADALGISAAEFVRASSLDTSYRGADRLPKDQGLLLARTCRLLVELALAAQKQHPPIAAIAIIAQLLEVQRAVADLTRDAR